MQDTAEQILKRYWGFETFRPLQKDIVTAVLEKKDVLALLPTGGGKSICFQVPALLKEGICLVVTPLIALMKDQVENLAKKGIPALSIYSGMPVMEVRKTLRNAAFGNYKFLYVSPERLETDLFLEFLPAIKPALIAVDEAHCISQWGYDFRPAYLRIAALREKLPGVPVIALTASATLEVQNDICEKLLFEKQSMRFQQSFSRPNLSYSVFEPEAKQTRLVEVLKNVKGSSIVYCKSRRQTQQIAEWLRMNAFPADYYHAGLVAAERTRKQEEWINNKIRCMVCTNAFGMGIDKPDVRIVVHMDMPESLEHYYQEAGRAGRDGHRAYAVMLFDKKETGNLFELLDLRYPDLATLKELYAAVMNYLQVPAGIGEGQVFDFDMALFADTFKLNILKASYGIQALAQEGLMSFTEVSFRPSTLEFTSSKSDLFEFEQQQPDLEPIIKALLRNYEGIFDYPSVIYESLLARFLQTNIEAVKKSLQILHRYGIVQYKPTSEKPQLLLLQNRMYSDDFKFNSKDISERKKKHENRLNAIIAFSTETIQCRSVMIGKYFNDKDIQPCGICDNCINNRDKAMSDAVFKEIADTLLATLKSRPMTIAEIELQYRQFEKKQVLKVIDYLRSENIINSDLSGYFNLS